MTPRALRATARPTLVLLLGALAAACAGARSHGGDAAIRSDRQRFTVPGHGALELGVPAGWTAKAGEGEAPFPVTVRLEDKDHSFQAAITPFWNPTEPGEASDTDADTAQMLTEMARRNVLSGSVEREIALQEVVGEGVHGFWFAATDKDMAGRAPGPEEWRHLMQGTVAVGQLLVAFTVLDNGPGPHRTAILEVVRNARHLPTVRAAPGEDAAPREGEGEEREGEGGAATPPSRPGDTPLEPDPGKETLPLAVTYGGKTWTVLVDLPGFRMFKPRPADDGGGTLVLGQSPDTGLVASVILRDAAGAADARACRDRAFERIRRAAADLERLELTDVGESARATYRVSELRGKRVPQDHAHVFLQREGVCVNVHVSKAEPEAADAERIRQIVESVRFGETL